ncbi:unnamed protein product [Ectocarpus sp. CCAP 1310/34]|nr:unnamed protein product [Ectocarpus sp. CCAP 1310/34]
MPSGGRHPSAENEPCPSALDLRRPRPRQLGWLKTVLLLLIALAVARTMLLRRQGAGASSGGIAGKGVSSSSSSGGGSFEAQRPRAAVCFFGLTRSLRWTLPSVQKRLLEVLRQGMAVDVFVHTYSLVEVNNNRAGETKVMYGPYVNDFLALNPTRSLVTNQDDFDLIWTDPLSMTHYNWNYPEEDAPGVIRNVFRAYWSMSMSWGLMAEHAVAGGFEYDAVVLARPDVWFHYDVDLPTRTLPLPEHTVFLPSFDAELAAQVRKNDRFAYGSMTTMRVVMNRLATLLAADTGQLTGEIDSEYVLGHHLRKNDISVQMLDLLLTRIRLTRDIPMYDHRLVEEACLSGEDPMACRMVDAGFKFPVDGGA